MRALRIGHRWLGLLLALPLLLQGLSGTVLALAPLVERAGYDGQPPAVVSADAIVAAALAAGPPGHRAARYVPAQSAGEPARVMLMPPGQARGPGLVVAVDPATAIALGPVAADTGVVFWIKRFHEHWLLPAWGGRQFAGWLGVGLVVLVVFGVPLWWPRPGGWRAAFTIPRRARGARLQRAMHGAMGGWCVLLMLATGITGITQGFPQTSRALLGADPGPRSMNRGMPSEPFSLDTAIALARAAAPDLQVQMALLPAGSDPLRLMLALTPGAGASAVTTATIIGGRSPSLALQTPEQRPMADRWLRVLRDIHVGEGFGPIWLTLAAIGGVALPGFGITGFLFWYIKRRNRQRARNFAPSEGQTGAV